jgi:PAS domain S-box-containing protein
VTDTVLPAVAADLDHADSLGLLHRQTGILELIGNGTPLPQVLTAVATALEELIPGCRCSILLLDPLASTLHHGAAPSLPPDYSAAIDGLPIGPYAGSCGSAAYRDESVVVSDIATDPLWDPYRDLALPHGLRACWSSPIRGRRGVLGTFAVYHGCPHRPDAREQRLVDRLTHLSSVAIDHAGLYGALAESEERFRRAFEDNTVGMALISLDGRLVKVNQALREVLGRTEVQLLGTPLDAVLPGTGNPPGEGGQYTSHTHSSDGRELELAVAASVVRGADGLPAQVCVNVADVTQRRAAQRERRARWEAEVGRRHAEAASRAKSEFVSGLSHELRTPLQAITGFTELLGTLDLPVERRHAALGHIATASSHILSLVDDTLDIARIEAGALSVHPEEVELSELASSVLDLLTPLADERGVVLQRVRTAATASVDRTRLRQVLINLVTNGIRYTPRGGWVRVGVQSSRGTVAVAVQDSGPGIPADRLERLFVPFDRLGAEGVGDGVGLGMALARGLTEAMGGRLLVRSEVGQGTTVAVVFPAA